MLSGPHVAWLAHLLAHGREHAAQLLGATLARPIPRLLAGKNGRKSGEYAEIDPTA